MTFPHYGDNLFNFQYVLICKYTLLNFNMYLFKTLLQNGKNTTNKTSNFNGNFGLLYLIIFNIFNMIENDAIK